MKSVLIRLESVENIRKFVDVTGKYNYAIKLSSGNYTVDGKSIMGIFGLDLARPVKMDVSDGNCDDLLSELKDFLV